MRQKIQKTQLDSKNIVVALVFLLVACWQTLEYRKVPESPLEVGTELTVREMRFEKDPLGWRATVGESSGEAVQRAQRLVIEGNHLTASVRCKQAVALCQRVLNRPWKEASAVIATISNDEQWVIEATVDGSIVTHRDKQVQEYKSMRTSRMLLIALLWAIATLALIYALRRK